MDQDKLILFSRILIAAEALAAFTGFFTWSKWKHTYIKWFPVYLLVIVLLELTNRIIEYGGRFHISATVNTLASLIEILFASYFFYQTLDKKNRKLIFTGVVIYVLSFIAEKTWINTSDYFFQSLSYTIGNLFILIYLILFFSELVQSNRLLHFNTFVVFWISTGMLIFYLGTFPYYGLFNELGKNLNLFIPAAWVATSLNYAMYLLFTIGFIWGKPQ